MPPSSPQDLSNGPVAAQNDVTSVSDTRHNDSDDPPWEVQKTFQFWAIIVGLGVTLLLSALENTVLVTAAPYILAELPLGDNWVWVTNAFFLCSAAFQPIIGQLCNIFGRRWVVQCIVAIFLLGSGICGGATNGYMLIAGRAVQGVGSGGILMAFDIIVSDLVPMRYRGNYIAIIMLIYSIGTTLGPFIGGALVEAGQWRWVFYINLPVGGVSMIVLFFFLNVNHRGHHSNTSWLKKIDFIGNGLLVSGCVAILLALTYAGTRWSWSSWHTLVPLLLGFAAFLLFGAYEASRWAPDEPVMPPRLFRSRTSVIVSINAFLNSCLLYWGLFFLPIFFQAVQLASPRRAGVSLIPLTLFGVPSAAIAAMVLTRFGKYKIIHLVAFSIFMIGRGLYTLLDENTSTGEWVAFQLFAGIGSGALLNTLLPPFQAPLQESDQAAATATFNFIRTLGSVWGVAIPAAVFSNYINKRVAAGAIQDPIASPLLTGGQAYQHASAEFVRRFPPPLQTEISGLYRDAIRHVFIVSFAFMGLALLITLFEKDIPLRKMLKTDFGLKDEETRVPEDARDKTTSAPDL